MILHCRIDQQGEVRVAEVLHGESPVLSEAAVAAVSQWRYEPTRDPEGRPVEADLTVTVAFRLSGKKDAAGR